MDKKSVVIHFFLPHTHTHTKEDIHEESLEDCPSGGGGPRWQVEKFED
jgi:hypothetical protein